MKQPYRLHLYIPLIITILIMLLSTVLTIIYIQDTSINKSKKDTPENFKHYLNVTVDNEAATLQEYIAFIQSRDDVAQRFQELDKNGLNNSVKDIYKRLNKNVNLTQMYFANSSLKCNT